MSGFYQGDFDEMLVDGILGEIKLEVDKMGLQTGGQQLNVNSYDSITAQQKDLAYEIVKLSRKGGLNTEFITIYTIITLVIGFQACMLMGIITGIALAAIIEFLGVGIPYLNAQKRLKQRQEIREKIKNLEIVKRS